MTCNSESTHQIVDGIIAQLRQRDLCTGQDLEDSCSDQPKPERRGKLGHTTVFPKSSSRKLRALEVYDIVSVPCSTTKASKVW